MSAGQTVYQSAKVQSKVVETQRSQRYAIYTYKAYTEGKLSFRLPMQAASQKDIRVSKNHHHGCLYKHGIFMSYSQQNLQAF